MISVAGLGRLVATVGGVGSLVRAVDAAERTEIVAPTDSLLDAMRKMGVRGAAALPVLDRASGRVVGLITRGHVVSAYERQLAALNPAAPGATGPVPLERDGDGSAATR